MSDDAESRFEIAQLKAEVLRLSTQLRAAQEQRDCDNPDACADHLLDVEYRLKQAEADLATERAARLQAERERDLAIAHDRQPYPTAHAYETVCAARAKWQECAEQAEARAAQAEREQEALQRQLDKHISTDDSMKNACRNCHQYHDGSCWEAERTAHAETKRRFDEVPEVRKENAAGLRTGRGVGGLLPEVQEDHQALSSRLEKAEATVAQLRTALKDALIVTRNYYAQAISRGVLEEHQERWKAALAVSPEGHQGQEP